MMDGRRPAGIMSGDPAAVQALAPVYRWLQESPDTAYRASLLPMRRTVAGELQPAIPGALLDLMRGGVDLMAGPQTGVMTPEATAALATLGGSAVTQAPVPGALAAMRGPGAKAALDMSEAARMARATEQGFTIDAYKGAYPYDYNTGPVYAYKNGKMVAIERAGSFPEELSNFQTPDKPYAGFFAEDPEVANRFASLFSEGAVFPAKLKMENPVIIDAKGKPAAAFQFDSAAQKHGTLSQFEQYKAALDSPDNDGVIIQNTSDEGTIFIPKKARQIRSRHAVFASDSADSPDMLASGGFPAIPPQQRDERR